MTPNYIALAIPVFFALIAIELAVGRWWRRERYYDFEDSITNLSCGIGQQVVGIGLKVAYLAVYVAVWEGFAVVAFQASSPWAWLIAFLGVDLAYYWWHRLSHRVNFLWAIHVVHHHSQEYNLSVALRQAWFSGLSSLPFYLPLAVIGIPPLVFFTTWAFSTLYQFWIHTRAISRLGPFEWVFNSPSHHRVHHAINPRYLDRNYAATLIVWDRLFGTFEDESETPVYGTVRVFESRDPVWANFDSWAHIARAAAAEPRWTDRLAVWFKPPGWKPRAGEATAPPVDAASFVKFATPAPTGVRLYVALQFAAVSAATTALMFGGDGTAGAVPVAAVAAGVAGILWTSWVWGALFERRARAVDVELARLLALAAAAALTALTGAVTWPLATLGVVFAAASGLWIRRYRDEYRGPAPVHAPAGGAGA